VMCGYGKACAHETMAPMAHPPATDTQRASPERRR
jgi:hypothetical protein